MEHDLRDHHEQVAQLDVATYAAVIHHLVEAAGRDPPQFSADSLAVLGQRAIQQMLPLQWGEDDPPSATAQLAPPDLTTTRKLMVTAVEVLDGRRSAFALYPYLNDHAYAGLLTRCRHTTPQPPARLRSLHAQHPAANVIEACALIDRGGRSQALAARLERRRRRWLGTVLRWL